MPQSPRLDLRPGVSEPVVLLISRREVEAGDLASVLSRLKVFLATREDAWLYRGQMTLVVDGYNNDPRELSTVGTSAGTRYPSAVRTADSSTPCAPLSQRSRRRAASPVSSWA